MSFLPITNIIHNYIKNFSSICDNDQDLYFSKFPKVWAFLHLVYEVPGNVNLQ